MELRRIKSRFSTLGLAFAALVGVGFLTYFLGLVLEGWLPKSMDTEAAWWVWLRGFVPTYLVGLPVCFVLLKRRLPAQPRECRSLKKMELLALLCISLGLMVPGNWSMNFLPRLFGNIPSHFNTLPDPLRCIAAITVVPLLEELVFRKLLIDRIGQWGEKLAVLVSAVIFGLFRLDLFSIPDGFILGALFAYVYIRTGKLRYPVILSAFVNLNRMVIVPLTGGLFSQLADFAIAEEASVGRVLFGIGGMLVMLQVMLCQMALGVLGIVLAFRRLRRLTWKPAPEQLPRRQGLKAAFLNIGMVIYIVLSLGLTVLALF